MEKSQAIKKEYPKGKGYIISRLEEAIWCIKNDWMGDAKYNALEAIDSMAKIPEGIEWN